MRGSACFGYAGVPMQRPLKWKWRLSWARIAGVGRGCSLGMLDDKLGNLHAKTKKQQKECKTLQKQFAFPSNSGKRSPAHPAWALMSGPGCFQNTTSHELENTHSQPPTTTPPWTQTARPRSTLATSRRVGRPTNLVKPPIFSASLSSRSVAPSRKVS